MNNLEAKVMHPALHLYSQYHIIQESNAISPYIVTIYALDILENSENTQQVADFILWYASHANKLDRFGVSGTIYDYNIDKLGNESSTLQYDSADGYAGLYLYLVYKYYEKTKDKTLVQKIWATLKDDVYLLLHLQDKDGLTKALAGKSYHTKYLMDNVESYLGVKSYCYLARILNKKTDTYLGLQNTIKNGIMNDLYDTDQKRFYWAKDNVHKTIIKNNIFYPDIFAQIHLLAFWGENLEPKVAQKLWHEILEFYTIHKPSFAMEQLIIFQWAKAYALSHQL